tara:strand:+ start:170 stop:400 length:231 start_codon:yes stop_codon:yes gene_type:complete
MPYIDTISFGLQHHLFKNSSKGENIILEVEKTDFEVDPERVAVVIPVDMWNQIVEDYQEKYDQTHSSKNKQLELDF